uniref:Uncharacterized protein n=1 Tax=Oryzias sinensis TaxID=183150 RepID=A0A8C7Y6H0_9TELE
MKESVVQTGFISELMIMGGFYNLYLPFTLTVMFHDTSSYPVSGLSDEDFNIPPITPPTLLDHMMPPPGPHSSSSGPYNPMESNCSLSLCLASFVQMQQMVNSDTRFTSSQQPIEAALGPRSQSGMSQQNHLSTINQPQLGLNGSSATHNSPSPPGSKSATPSPPSSNRNITVSCTIFAQSCDCGEF